MQKKKQNLTSKPATMDRRIQIFLFICFALFAVLAFRIWNIQIYRHAEFTQKALRNHVRELPVKCKRGRILDTHGRILAEDINFWDIWVPIKFDRRGNHQVDESTQKTLTLLSEIIGTKYKVLEHRYLTGRRDLYYKHLRVCIARNIPFDQYVALQTRLIEFPQNSMAFPEAVPVRFYRYGSMGAHVLGRMGEISPTELRMEMFADYKQGNRVGKRGLEKQYESYLRGTDGMMKVYVDKYEIQRGRADEYIPSVPGHDIKLNIDIDLQLAAERVLGASRGAIVAMNPKNNAVLALASSPRFDPNDRNYNKYSIDPAHPLYHRAVSSAYPPGSVFKIFELLPILEEMKVSPEATEYCPGYYAFPPGSSNIWRCHKRSGHGHVDLTHAVTVSCDCYFYKMIGTKLGIDRLFPWTVKFGLNDPTGIDLPQEKTKPFPSPRTVYPWYRGFDINTSIGQGDVSLTPLQICTGMCAVANRGKLIQPRLVDEIIAPDGTVVKKFEPKVAGVIEASTRTWDIVHNSMFEVVDNELRGTGRRIKDDEFTIAGKTGTAEVDTKEPHAWFVCFAPVEDPQIMVTVIVENSGHGGEIAAPMAKTILEVFFGRVRVEELV